MIEAVAQLAGTIAQSDPVAGPLPGLKLTALRSAKILGSAKPGDTLQVAASILGRLGNLIQAQGTVEVAGQVILKAEVTLSGDKP